MPVSGINIISSVLLAQAQPESGASLPEEALPPGLDIFVRPKPETKRRKPEGEIREPKPPTSLKQPPAVPYQEIPVSDDLYQEFLMLGEAYQEVRAALNEERVDRQLLEERVAELEKDFTAKINTLLGELGRRDVDLKVLAIGLAGGVVLLAWGGALIAVKMVRSQNRKLHEVRLRAIDESAVRLRGDWEQHSRAIAEEAASRAVEAWEQGRQDSLMRRSLQLGRDPLAGWRDWMSASSSPSLPPSSSPPATPTPGLVTRLDQLTFEAFVRKEMLERSPPNVVSVTVQLKHLRLLQQEQAQPAAVVTAWRQLTPSEKLDYLKADVLGGTRAEIGLLPRGFVFEYLQLGVTAPQQTAEFLYQHTDWFGRMLPETRTELATVMAHWLNGLDRPERDTYFLEDNLTEAFAAKAREAVVEVPAGARSGQARRASVRRLRRWHGRESGDTILSIVSPKRRASILELSRGVRGFGRITAPFVGLDVAEHFEVVSSGQKTALIGSLIAGMTWVERWTPAHLLALAPAFALGGQITDVGLATFGVEHPLVRNVGKTVGSFAAAEGFLTWIGKGAGAQSLREAHHLGRQVLHNLLIHTVQSVAAAGSRFIDQAKALLPSVGAVIAGGAAGEVIFGSAVATAGVALAVGAAAFSAVHYSGVGERLGNIAGDAAFYGIRKLRNWFSPFS